MWCNRNGSVKENSWCRRFYTPTECILGGFCLSRKPFSGWKNLVDSCSTTSWLTSPERHCCALWDCTTLQPKPGRWLSRALTWRSQSSSELVCLCQLSALHKKRNFFWWYCCCSLGHWLTISMLFIPSTWNCFVRSNSSICRKSNDPKYICV